MKTGKRKISVVAVKLLTCVCCLCLQPIPVGLAASPGLELTPVVVWQGVAVGEHHIKALAAIRGSLADLRVVHMANPVYLMRSGAEWNFYRNSMASLLKRGDVVGMHIAPLRDWSTYSKVKPGAGRGVFGQNTEACGDVCGLDLEMAGLSHKDLGIMFSTAKAEFRRSGLGEPRLAMFEEGLVANDIWSAAKDAGLEEDWSGFNSKSVRALFGMYPFFIATEQMAAEFSGLSRGIAFDNGRSLDHLRFGIVLDALGVEQVKSILSDAAVFAKANGRKVIVPVMISATSSIHSGPLVQSVLDQAKKIATAEGLTLGSWSGSYDGGWSEDGLRMSLVAKAPEVPLKQEIVQDSIGVAPAVVPVGQLFEGGFPLDSGKDDSVPAEQPVIQSHAHEMSH